MMINIDKSINKILGNKKKQTKNNSNNLFNTNKILNTSSTKGASIQMQNKWKNMSMFQRNNARRMLPDRDGDRVPDMFDCSPNNTMRQDFMLDSDQYDSDKKQFKHAYTGRKVVMMPVEELYHMRARYNLDNKSYVPTDDYSYMRDTRDLIAKEKGLTDVQKYKLSDKEVAKEMINEREDMLKRRKLVPYPSKIRNDESGFVKGTNIKYRHTPNKYKQEVEFIMQPNNYGKNAGKRSKELEAQGMAKKDVGTTLRNEYYNDMIKAVKSKEAKVPMVILHGMDVKENVMGEGRHRIMAAREAGIKEIPVFVEPNNRLPKGSLDKYRELTNEEVQQYIPKKDKVINIPLEKAWEMRANYSRTKDMSPKREQYTMDRIKTAIKNETIDPIEVEYDDYNRGVLTDGKHRLIVMKEENVDTVPITVKNVPPINNLMSDTDGDGVANVMDCDPNDETKQGPTHKYMQSRRPTYEENRSWYGIRKQHKRYNDFDEDENKIAALAIRKRMREKAEREAYEDEVINNINMQVRELGTSLKNKKKNPADKLMSDTDGDGVVDAMDCDPNNKTKQGPTHNYYNYSQIAKHSVRNRGEINRQGSCLGHCAQLSSDIYHNLSAGHTEAKTINVDLYNDEPIRHKAVYVPKDDVVIDTQVWQFTNDNNKNLRNRKVVFTPEEYEDLGFTIEDKRTI